MCLAGKVIHEGAGGDGRKSSDFWKKTWKSFIPLNISGNVIHLVAHSKEIPALSHGTVSQIVPRPQEQSY